MKKFLALFFALFVCITLQAQTVTLPPYYGVQKPQFICGVSTVTDYVGNVYNTVKIGDQCWLRENLKSTKYNDGTSIPAVTDAAQWASLTTPARTWYNNNYTTYGSVYGALYNWYTVNTGKLCPLGWHVPSDAEWTQLVDFLGGESVAGGKLKETGTAHWQSPNTGATNETGFTALPGGYRWGDGSSGTFDYIGDDGNWWSTTYNNGSGAKAYNMSYLWSDIWSQYYEISIGISVRCIKD